jgi:hypothetical protein
MKRIEIFKWAVPEVTPHLLKNRIWGKMVSAQTILTSKEENYKNDGNTFIQCLWPCIPHQQIKMEEN